MKAPFLGLLVILLAIGGVALGQTAPGTVRAPRVSPRPQVENYGGQGMIKLHCTLPSGAGTTIAISFRKLEDLEDFDSGAVEAGTRLLSKRLGQLGSIRLSTKLRSKRPEILLEKCSAGELAATLTQYRAGCEVSGKRLDQAYVLECSATASGLRSPIVLRACSDRGLFYAMVSLCQLLDRDAGGAIVVPEVKIADWPEIGLRLAKTSASLNGLSDINRFADWMPLFKINLIGLQFHGDNSMQPGAFTENVRTLCSSAAEEDILDTIVYFCPFRGKGYDFNAPADRQKYAELLQWILRQGADGIEVDYNDWPGSGTPVEDVINLAVKAVGQVNPEAYLLYCPPNRGASQYRGPASEETRRVLSEIPDEVWPLWTGMTTLVQRRLTVEQVETWTRQAGRRPFFWLNRVSPRVDHAFAQRVEEVPGALVFCGERLPKELHRLFEGVHFNAGFSRGYNELPEDFDTESLAYMATAADYVWNPRGWNAVESARRAARFVSIMQALAGQ